ncbi:hypothetical protein [Rubrivirga sp. IMCC45206]|uniref:hypothetical protein n=1 Tax=Rubrivirga sp. IMCC45206 TaxID=3391614 RepID=UPI0039901EA5
MRLVLAALALVLLAAPASSQSQYADGEGLYVSFDEFRVRHSGGEFQRVDLGGEVGRRLGNGIDVGLVGSYHRYGFSGGGASWSAGVSASLTRPAPLGTIGRVRGVVSYGSTRIPNPSAFDRSYGQVDLSATLARTVPVVGSIKLQPTVGVYGRMTQLLSVGSEDVRPRPDGPLFDTGVQVELPIQFRLFGADVALAPAMRFSIPDGLRREPYGFAGSLLRVNF